MNTIKIVIHLLKAIVFCFFCITSVKAQIVSPKVKTVPCPKCMNLQFVLPGKICSGEKIKFENTSTGCDSNAYFVWDFGDGTPVSTNPYHTYSVVGSFTVKLFIPGSIKCPKVELSRKINVKSCPEFDCNDKVDSCHTCSKLSFTTPIRICLGENITFINNSTGCTGNVKFIWNFGDGSPLSSSPIHSFSGIGLFTIKLIIPKNGDCPEKSVSKEIQVVNCIPPDSCKGFGVTIIKTVSSNSWIFTANVIAGTPPYQFAWTASSNLNPFTGQGTNRITTPIPPGGEATVYSVSVVAKDRQNCTITKVYTYPGN